MQVDGLFSLIDRQAIAILKSFKFAEAGNKEAAALAKEQADDLMAAGDIYIFECMTGKRKPYAVPSLRFHNHRQAEGKWAGKLSEMDEPKTIMECAGQLALVHAQYWSLQTRIQTLKGMIDRDKNTIDVGKLHEKFVSVQREIDKKNQERSDLIALGDSLFLQCFHQEDA